MATKVSWYQRILDRVRAILDESAFHLHGEPSRLYKFIHFWILVWRSFARNRCLSRATALSYSTLIALIPMLALAMSVTTSMLKSQGKEQIEQFIANFVATVVPPGPTVLESTNSNGQVTSFNTNLTANATNAAQPELAATSPTNVLTNAAVGAEDKRLATAQKEAAEKIFHFVQNAQSGAVTGLGAVGLILVAILMVRSIESTLNDIWGVERGRGWGLSIALYWTAVTLGPALMAFAVGLTSGTHFKATRVILERYDMLGFIVFKVLPIVVVWLAFALFYKAIPNTKVRFDAALVGGIVGGTVWHFNNMFGFLYVSRVVSNSKIYGGLGLVPVFMAGIYLSWVIFLFGAQVAYAFQNRKLYFQEKLAEHVNQRGREFVALRLMTCLGQRYLRGLPPPTVQQMSDELGVPSRLVQQVLQTLLAAHLVMEVSGADPAYVPARPLENINAHHVLMAMRATVGQELMTRDEPVRQEVFGEFARIQEAEKQVASAVTLLALVNRAEARLEIEPPRTEEKEISLKPALVPSARVEPEPASLSASVTAVTEWPYSKSEPSPGAIEPTSKKDSPKRPSTEPDKDEDREFPL